MGLAQWEERLLSWKGALGGVLELRIWRWLFVGGKLPWYCREHSSAKLPEI